MAVGGFVPRLGAAALLACLALHAAASRGEEAPPRSATKPAEASAEPDAPTLAARARFKSGIKLYRDANYAGALAEFEEAYRLKPGPGSLQNVALCQKALFRYAEAASTLEQLLGRHASELSEGERKAVDEALGELRGLIASVRLRVTPETARVLLDGRLLTASDLATPLVVNVGEHAISVDAPGYAPERRLLRIAGGQKDVPLEIQLRCVAGFVDVSSNDPSANIAIDGLPKARRAYRGPVEPDTDHLLQVYREGVEPFERTFQVGTCKTLAIRAELEGLENAPPSDAGGEAALLGAPPQPKAQRGFYGLLTLALLGLSQQPLSLDASKAKGGALGAIGLRAGYRLSNPIALELLLDAGALEVVGAVDDGSGVPTTRDYSLRSIHFGPNLKLMTTGERLRFVTGVGAGIVHHRLAITSPAAKASGVDPYFLLELGLGFNFKHFLGELGLIALIDGSSALQRDFSDAQSKSFTRDLGTTLPMVGVGLRGGFSEWRPSR